MSNNIIKKKKKIISLEKKVEILNRLKDGESVISLSRFFGLHVSTIKNIRKRDAVIRQSVANRTKASIKLITRSRVTAQEKMETALIKWIEENYQKRIPSNLKNIQRMALQLYKEFNEQELSNLSLASSSKKKNEFNASMGWVLKFIKKHSLDNLNMKRGYPFADKSGVTVFLPKIAKIIEEGGYTTDQVFNTDEAGLLWKKMPSKTNIAKSEKNRSGCKVSKDRVNFLLCSNASGNHMLKPLFINRTLHPFAISMVKADELPFHWRISKSSWVTNEIFTDWFNNLFVPEVKSYLENKGLQFKVLLLIGNFSDLPELEHPNIKVVFLPHNSTSLIQPLSRGIILTFKLYYIKRTFEYLLNEFEKDGTLISDAWKTFNMMNCVQYSSEALSELSPSILNACWRSLWPKCVMCKSENFVSEKIIEIYSDIITLSRTIGREGFEDLKNEDITELIAEEILSEDKILNGISEQLDDFTSIDSSDNEEMVPFSSSSISEGFQPAYKNTNNILKNDHNDKEMVPLTASLISEGFQLANKLTNHFLKNDHDFERAKQFQRDLKTIMEPYRELYKEQKS